MRDEYLQLYESAECPVWITEQINWLGTHLIRMKYPQAETISSPEPYPITLDQILVPTATTVEDVTVTVHVPGRYNSAAITEHNRELAQHRVDKNYALQAFLSLPNVNSFSGDIMEDFHNTYIATFRDAEDAIRSVIDLDEREREILDYASDRHLFFDYLTPDWEALKEEASELVDLVEIQGYTYVFAK